VPQEQLQIEREAIRTLWNTVLGATPA
jgi:hypothetical protein